MRRSFCFYITMFSLILIACGKNKNDSTYTSVLEGRTVQVPALTGGKILSVSVEEGDEVVIGDVLAVTDTVEIVLQKSQLNAVLEELSVQEEIADINLRRTKTDFEYIQEKLDRMKILVDNEAVPKQNFDDLSNLLKQAESAHVAAQQTLRGLYARRKQLVAQIAIAQKKIADAKIVAPTDGMVSSRYYEPGEAVPPYRPILELIHHREMEVKIYLPEKKLPLIKIGQAVVLRVDGLDREFSGRIAWVSPKAEFTPKTILTPETRTSLVYAVKVTVSNPEGVLKHGMPVEVVLK